MLWFVGLGVSGIDSISVATQKLLKDSDLVYLEQFTSPISTAEISKIRKLAKSKLKIAKRWLSDPGRGVLAKLVELEGGNKEALQKEYDRGWLLGRETAVEELRYILEAHFQDNPNRGILTVSIDLLEERLDLK